MLTLDEKRYVSTWVEKTIDELNHPELEPGTYTFMLSVQGEEEYSQAHFRHFLLLMTKDWQSTAGRWLHLSCLGPAAFLTFATSKSPQ